MTSKEAINFMKSKGFPYVYKWKDVPGTLYEEHFHKGKTALYTLSGSVEFYFSENTETKILQAGEYFEVEPLKKHNARVGENGWEVIVGEMIEGDS